AILYAVDPKAANVLANRVSDGLRAQQIRSLLVTITKFMKTALRVLALVLICNAVLFPQGRNYGRSMVITQQGIAATSQTLASQAGAQILTHGGSAVDAGIAANAVLCVTEPMMDGLGGDLFVIYWDAATGKLTGLNASGPAPRALSPEFLENKGVKHMPRDGIHSVTVPGA